MPPLDGMRILAMTQYEAGTSCTQALGCAARLSASKVPMKFPPRLGEHTDDVLRTNLQLDAAKLASLRDSGVLG